MSTQRIRYNTPLTTALASSDLFKEEPFFLVDVGASGGIENHWNAFIPHLRAVGFEPLLAEAERLKQLFSNPMIKYESAFVGYKTHPRELPREKLLLTPSSPLTRSSASRAKKLCNMNYIRSVYNRGKEVKYTDKFIELDSFFEDGEKEVINFLKVDTDGYDYQVLLGAEKILTRGNLLGLSVEVMFQGEFNRFSQVDVLLGQHGFSLFDLEVYRYSRGDLPKPFFYKLPAQTIEGQVVWGEAVYFRDLGDKNYEEIRSWQVKNTHILKLACLFEIFGLEDCCAELLIKYREQLQEAIDIDKTLDMLVPQAQGKNLTFVEYNQEFENYVKNTFGNEDAQTQKELEQSQSILTPACREIGIQFHIQPTQTEQERSHSQLQQPRTELEQKQAELEGSHSQWQHNQIESADYKAQVEQLQGVIRAMENSKFWKLRTAWLSLKRAIGIGKKD